MINITEGAEDRPLQSRPLVGGTGTTGGQRQSERHQEREPRTIHGRCLF